MPQGVSVVSPIGSFGIKASSAAVRLRLTIKMKDYREGFMRRFKFALLYAWLVGALCVAAGQTSKPPTPSFSLAITSETTVKASSSIMIRVVMTNIAGSDIVYGEGPSNGYDVTILDKSGKNILAPSEDHSKDVPSAVTMLATLTLQEGDKRESRLSLDEYSKLRTPGKYTVQVSKRDIESGVVVRSNQLLLTITH